jgi:hypothetical protein
MLLLLLGLQDHGDVTGLPPPITDAAGQPDVEVAQPGQPLPTYASLERFNSGRGAQRSSQQVEL